MKHLQKFIVLTRFFSVTAICSILTTTDVYCVEEMPVLLLDGRSHVELPRNLFDRTTQATIEVWVRWNRFNKWSRVFDFGRKDNAVVLQNQKSSNTLNYRIWDRSGKRHGTKAKKAVNTGAWYHIAVVSGSGGMKFYINGRLMDRDGYSGSLGEAAGGNNFVGKSNWPKDELFEGYISELRIWSKRRSQSEIRFAMEKALAGTEDGLLAYYRFTDATDRLIPNVVDPDLPARMVGSARLEDVRAIAPLLVPGALEEAALASYQEAKAALDAEQFATAIDQFKRLEGIYPRYKDSDVLFAQARRLEAERQAGDFYQTGMQHVQQGRFRQAYLEFESALNQVPGFKDAQTRMQDALEKATYRVAVYPFKTASMGLNMTLFQQELTTSLMQDKSVFVEYADQYVINRLFTSQGSSFGVIDPTQTLSAAKNEDIRVVVYGNLTSTANQSNPHVQSRTAYTALKSGGKIVGRGPRQVYHIISQDVQVNCTAAYQIMDTRTGSVLHFGTVREDLSDRIEYAEYPGDKRALMSKVYRDENAKTTRWIATQLREPRFNARRDLRNPGEMLNEALRGLGVNLAREVNDFMKTHLSVSSQ